MNILTVVEPAEYSACAVGECGTECADWLANQRSTRKYYFWKRL